MSRKKARRALWLWVVVALMAVAAAACSPSGTADREGDAAGTGSTTSAPSTASGEPAAKGEISVSIYDRGNVPAEEGTPADNRWTEWINENAPVNVKFVAVPRNAEDEKYNTLFAAGEAPDLIFTWTPNLRNKLYSQKQLLPLDEYIENYSTEYKQVLEEYPVLKKMGVKSDGKLYGLGAIAPLEVQTGWFIRSDWLKKLNLPIPETTEELYLAIKAFVEQDPDGNQLQDTYGINMSAVGGQNIDNMFGSGYGWYVDGNGQLIHDWDRAAASTAFKKRLYDEGLVDRDYLTDKDGEKAKQDFITGKLGIYGVGAVAGSTGLKLYESLKQNIPGAEVAAIPLPASEFGRFSPYVSPPFYLAAVVNAQTKDPKAVIEYVDWLMKDDINRTLKYGFEGVHWAADENGCPTPIDSAKNQKELDWAFDFYMLDMPIRAGQCADYTTQLDVGNPVQKEYIDIVNQARAAYLSPDRPVFHDIDFSSLPDFPKDMQLNRDTALDAAYMIFAKAIVGGPSYSMDAVLEDAQAAWISGGGREVDDFLASWFAENKDTIVYSKDYYSVMK